MVGLAHSGWSTCPLSYIKSGIAGIVRLSPNEWASKNINVNAIAPGYIATNTQQLRPDAERSKAILDRIPADRWGLPSDFAGAAIFLAPPASHYLNRATSLSTAAGALTV